MLLKELKIVFRKLQREINYTLINLMGLTIGISFSFLIYVYVSDQLSFDQHIPNADQIYRVASEFELNGHTDIYANAPRPMGPTLVEEFPGIIAATKIMGYNGNPTHSGYVQVDEAYHRVKHLYAADSNFFKVFEIPWLAGTNQALKDPNSAVISKSLAERLFNSTDVIGQTFNVGRYGQVVIKGVFEDHLPATYFRFELLVSYTTFFNSENGEKWWYGGHVMTYLKTTPEFRPENVHQNWRPFYEKHMKSTFDKMNGTAKIILQPLTEIYLWEPYIWEPYPHGNRQYLFVFSIIGIFLLLVAGFNFTNLSLSQSLHFQKEIGVRKILGASRAGLIRYRLLESLLISWAASVLAVSMLVALVPVFSQLTAEPIAIDFQDHPEWMALIFMIGTSCGLLAGVYPAILTSSFRFLDTIGKGSGPLSKAHLRKLFVLAQQVIAIVLIIGTLVVIDQINFIRNRDLGFDVKNLVIVYMGDKQLKDNFDQIRAALKAMPGIANTAQMGESPKTGLNEFSYMLQHANGNFETHASQTIDVGPDFIETAGLTLLAGRTFTKQDGYYKGVIINEYLASKMGYTAEKALGIKVKFSDDDETGRTVVGVIENFSMSSAKEPMQAMTLGFTPVVHSSLLLRIENQDPQQVLTQVEALFKEHGSALPFGYSFLDQEMDDLMSMEGRLYHLLILGSLLIMIISSLGLLGLITHQATSRTKEIGIRKVMGADNRQLFWILIEDFVKTYCFALLIGSVLAWYFASGWLSEYAYRVDFQWTNLVIAGVTGFVIVLFTLTAHTLSVIQANPVQSLRYE